MPQTSSDVTETCNELFLKPGMSESESALACWAGGMWPGKDKNNLNIQEKTILVSIQLFPFSWKGSNPLSTLCSLLYSCYCLINCNFGLRPRCSLHFIKGVATTWVEDGGRFSVGILGKGSSRSCVLLMKEGISCWSLWTQLLCDAELWKSALMGGRWWLGCPSLSSSGLPLLVI